MRSLPFRRGIATATAPPRVHVLGLGSIGAFAAHALAEVPNRLPVTLLLHRSSLMDGYVRNGKHISLKTRTGESVIRGGYDFEVLRDKKWHHIDQRSGLSDRPANGTIEELVVCVKSTQTVAALRPLLPRLTPRSSIMFLQNGAGMIEDVNEHLFPDVALRPQYITGVISHGVTLNGPFNITHTGAAATSIGFVPRSNTPRADESSGEPLLISRYLLRALPLVPRFNCKSYDWPEIFQIQLEKLAVNAISNPLCALADSITDYVFTIPETCRSLISEISSIAVALPELKGIPGVEERFSPKMLGSTVMSILDRNRETTCSMVWDLRAGRETEIRYINGYWSRRGQELGVPTPMNDDLVAKIEAWTAEANHQS